MKIVNKLYNNFLNLNRKIKKKLLYLLDLINIFFI